MNMNEIMNLDIEDEQYKTFLSCKLLEEKEFRNTIELSKICKNEDIVDIIEALGEIKEGIGDFEDIELKNKDKYTEVFVNTKNDDFEVYWIVHDNDVRYVGCQCMKECIKTEGFRGWRKEFVEKFTDIDSFVESALSEDNEIFYLASGDYRDRIFFINNELYHLYMR